MAKKKQKAPHEPRSPWDHGPDTYLARRGTVVEQVEGVDPDTGKKINPNSVTRRRRVDQVEKLWRSDKITRDQYEAAKKLREAFLATQRTPPAIKAVQVDSSPKPDAAIAMQIDRVSKFHAIARHIPTNAAPLVDAVVMMDRPVSGDLGDGRANGHRTAIRLIHLRLALDAVARGIGLSPKP